VPRGNRPVAAPGPRCCARSCTPTVSSTRGGGRQVEAQAAPRRGPKTGPEWSRGMGRDGTGVILLQGKELLRLPRNSTTALAPQRSTGLSRCSVVAQQQWLLVPALIGVTSAATRLRLGVGLNVSRSAPRGIYWRVADTPVRGALVVVCPPGAWSCTRCSRPRPWGGRHVWCPGEAAGHDRARRPGNLRSGHDM
jgi:hypothetical protein